MTDKPTPTDRALAQLRHLYNNLMCDGVRDSADSKRIAQGLLAPAIESLELGTPAPPVQKPLTPERVKEIVLGAGYDQCGIPDTERAAFINGLRHGEAAHGIKGGQHAD